MAGPRDGQHDSFKGFTSSMLLPSALPLRSPGSFGAAGRSTWDWSCQPSVESQLTWLSAAYLRPRARAACSCPASSLTITLGDRGSTTNKTTSVLNKYFIFLTLHPQYKSLLLAGAGLCEQALLRAPACLVPRPATTQTQGSERMARRRWYFIKKQRTAIGPKGAAASPPGATPAAVGGARWTSGWKASLS